MQYEIQIEDSVFKFLEKLNKPIKNKILDKVYELANNPRPYGSIKMSGNDSYRIRVGDYRVIYEINDKVVKVYIVKIGHRKDVYE